MSDTPVIKENPVASETEETVTISKAQLDELIQQNMQLKQDVSFCINFTYTIIGNAKQLVGGNSKSMNPMSLLGSATKLAGLYKELTSSETELGKQYNDFNERYSEEIKEVQGGGE